MTLEKTRELLKKYDEMIRTRYPDIEPTDQSGHIAVFGYQPGPKLLEHGRWMCQKALEFDGLVRANRWLGFIQCILLIHRVCGLDEMRSDTRPGPTEAGPDSQPRAAQIEDDAATVRAFQRDYASLENGERTAPIEMGPITRAAFKSAGIDIPESEGKEDSEPAEESSEGKAEEHEDGPTGEVEEGDADEAFERLTGESPTDSEEE